MGLSLINRFRLWVLLKFTPSPWEKSHLFRRGLLATILLTIVVAGGCLITNPTILNGFSLPLPILYFLPIVVFIAGVIASYFRVIGLTEGGTEESIVTVSMKRRFVLLVWFLCSTGGSIAAYLYSVHILSIGGIGPITLTPTQTPVIVGLLGGAFLYLSVVFWHLTQVGPAYTDDRRYYVNEYTLLEEKWREASVLLEEGHTYLQNGNPTKAVYYFSKAEERYDYLSRYGERDTYVQVADIHKAACKAYKESVLDDNESSSEEKFQKGNFYITKANEVLKYRRCDTCGFITKVSNMHRAISADGVERKLECAVCRESDSERTHGDEYEFKEISELEQEFENITAAESKQETQQESEEETVTDPYGDEEDGKDEDIFADEMEELTLEDSISEEETPGEEDKAEESATTHRKRSARREQTTLDEKEFARFTQRESETSTDQRDKVREEKEKDEEQQTKEETEDTTSRDKKRKRKKDKPGATQTATERQTATNRRKRGASGKRKEVTFGSGTESSQKKRAEASAETTTTTEYSQTKTANERPSSREPVSSAQSQTETSPETTVEEEEPDETDEASETVSKPDREYSDKTDRVTVEWACEVLGIEKPLDEQKIKRAYRKEVARTHPDKGGTTDDFEKVQDAKERLETYLKYTTN